MRIERAENGWKILAPSWPDGVCLARLARRSGYRVCQMCDRLGCSEGYFRRAFLRDTGVSPKRWLRDERMLMARRQLEEGRDPAEVAEALGFASMASFRREFRGVFCRLPLQWGRDGGSREVS